MSHTFAIKFKDRRGAALAGAARRGPGRRRAARELVAKLSSVS